jgi:hypothetical protein
MTNEPNNATGSNDPLDVLLREADEYVPDNGFTARVLTALPARRRKSWLRLAILGAATMVSSALAVWWLPSASDILAVASHGISRLDYQSLLVLVPVAAVIATVLWGLFEIVREEE